LTSKILKQKSIIMSVQNPDQYSQGQHQKSNSDANDPQKSTSVTDKETGVGENEGNHTSGGYIQYEEEGASSQNETGGEDGRDVHTDNQGGNSSE